MPRKTAKQIVDEVVAKVNKEIAPKKEEPKTVEHNRLCMTVVTGGGTCNCPASLL